MRIDRVTDLDWPSPDPQLRTPETGESGDVGATRSLPPGLAARLRRSRPRSTVGRATLLLGAGAAVLVFYSAWGKMSEAGRASITRELPQPVSAVTALPPPNLLKPLSPQEAAKENADRPFVNRPDTPASKFVLRTDAADRDRALSCLTQAIYYEAASEGSDGGRAVAQVVLNRMHHPGYPASVCGVVYQGADRTTGCQFTFACDGSLLRTPVASLWTRSRKIAEDALAGHVFAPVGHATHYHADYVLPYWADSLDKSVQIGRHIFYRLRSSLGDSRSFLQRYAGTEPQLPTPDKPNVIPPEAVTQELAKALLSDEVAKLPVDVEKASAATSGLLADTSNGTLLAGTGPAPKRAHKMKPTADCAPDPDRRKLTPLGANDVHAGSNLTC
jgi:spore germination cell wall hydrolase CwlJ-like protein